MEDILGFHQHISTTARGSEIFGWSMWIFKSRIGNFTQTLLKSLTIPQVEYGCAIWSLNDQKLNLLRGVQRRFTSRNNFKH